MEIPKTYDPRQAEERLRSPEAGAGQARDAAKLRQRVADVRQQISVPEQMLEALAR